MTREPGVGRSQSSWDGEPFLSVSRLLLCRRSVCRLSQPGSDGAFAGSPQEILPPNSHCPCSSDPPPPHWPNSFPGRVQAGSFMHILVHPTSGTCHTPSSQIWTEAQGKGIERGERCLGCGSESRLLSGRLQLPNGFLGLILSACFYIFKTDKKVAMHNVKNYPSARFLNGFYPLYAFSGSFK